MSAGGEVLVILHMREQCGPNGEVYYTSAVNECSCLSVSGVLPEVVRVEPIGDDGLTDTERTEVLAEWGRTYAHRPSAEEIAAIRARHVRTPSRD